MELLVPAPTRLQFSPLSTCHPTHVLLFRLAPHRFPHNNFSADALEESFGQPASIHGRPAVASMRFGYDSDDHRRDQYGGNSLQIDDRGSDADIASTASPAMLSRDRNGPLQQENPGANEEGSRDQEYQDLTGALSKYLWPQKTERQEKVRQLSLEERRKLAHSVSADDPELLHKLDRLKFKLIPSDFGSILQRFGQQKKWDKMCLVFDWMKVNKKLRSSIVVSFIMMLGEAELHWKALRAYKGIPDSAIRLDKFVCRALLRILVQAGCIEKAFSLFDEIKVQGFIPDSIIFNTLISGCAKQQNGYPKAKRLIAEMSDMGLKPDSFIYASLLHVCAKSGHDNEAQAVFEEMKMNKIEPTIFHYCSLLNCYGRTRKWEEAEKIFEEMKEAGLPVNQIVINCMLKAYSNAGKVEKARQLFDQIPSLGLSQGEISYCLLLDLYCKAKKMQEADLLFREMKEKGFKPGSYAFSCLISAYARMGRIDKVESLRRELENAEPPVTDPNVYNTLLKSFCELGMRDAVVEVLETMDAHSITRDRATFNILICYFCKEHSFDLALHTLAGLKVKKLRPNLNSYAPLIQGLAESGKLDQSLNLFLEMREANIMPSSALWSIMIETFCKDGKVNEAFLLFKDMMDVSISPSPSCVEQLLISVGDQLDLLDQILGSISKTHVDLNQVKLGAVFSAYQKQDANGAIDKLLGYMREHGYEDASNRLIESLREAGETANANKLSERSKALQAAEATAA